MSRILGVSVNFRQRWSDGLRHAVQRWGGKNVAISQKKKKKGLDGQVEYYVHLRKKEREKGTAITNNNNNKDGEVN